jgi:hypothetical protein
MAVERIVGAKRGVTELPDRVRVTFDESTNKAEADAAFAHLLKQKFGLEGVLEPAERWARGVLDARMADPVYREIVERNTRSWPDPEAVPQHLAHPKAPELSDEWYAVEVLEGIRILRLRQERIVRGEPIHPAEVADAFHEAIMLGARLRELEANGHAIVVRGENARRGSSAGGKNKPAVCKRRSCTDEEGREAPLSECGHAPWEEEAMALFDEIRRRKPEITKAVVAREIKRNLGLKVSIGTIKNALAKTRPEISRPNRSHLDR